MKKVVLCLPIPFSGMMARKTFQSIQACEGQYAGLSVSCAKSRSSNVPRGRNALAVAALDSGADWIITIDGDMVFTRENIVRAVSGAEDVVTAGAYVSRDRTDQYCAGMWGEYVGDATHTKRVPAAQKGKIAIDWSGTGFLAIPASMMRGEGVLAKKKPWFRYNIVGPEGDQDFTSEDLGFCMLCKECGVPIVLDCDNVIGHEPLSLPMVAPSVDLRDWMLKYNDLQKAVSAHGEGLAKAFLQYVEDIEGK
jgi:glycosyltransferase involved in cell wall biosynthesis